MSSHKYDYDAIIIGAGISGLVCGCYLAKAGLKTLIVEKNAKPGGYCTSFSRNGFYFDACAHSLGSLRNDGIIRQVIKGLDIESRIKMHRHDPQDIIISPDHNISFWNKLDKTINGLGNAFPKESKNIKTFLTYLDNSKGLASAQLRNRTLKDLLDEYFNDIKLKAFFSVLILGNLGLPPSLISAFTATKFYKEFIIDGGYYPEGGMQAFSDILSKRFKEYGGDLSLSSLATKVRLKDKKVEGVEVWDKDFITSKYVISNCDSLLTFQNLIGEETIGKEIINKLSLLSHSLSMFILYLGTDGKLNSLPKPGVNMWLLPNYDIEDMYTRAKKGMMNNSTWLMMRVMPDQKSIIMFVNSSFKDMGYWRAEKHKLIKSFIKRLEFITPDLSRHVVLSDAATPHTLYKWTLNHEGSSYGWESLPNQFAVPGLSQTTPIKNLYLTGHWTTLAQGIPGVVYLGRDTAQIITRREKKSL
jgi:phytoene dehydrogenase-like protein